MAEAEVTIASQAHSITTEKKEEEEEHISVNVLLTKTRLDTSACFVRRSARCMSPFMK